MRTCNTCTCTSMACCTVVTAIIRFEMYVFSDMWCHRRLVLGALVAQQWRWLVQRNRLLRAANACRDRRLLAAGVWYLLHTRAAAAAAVWAHVPWSVPFGHTVPVGWVCKHAGDVCTWSLSAA